MSKTSATSTSVESDIQTIEDVWDRRDKIIQKGFDLPEVALIDAPPGTGKSYGLPAWAEHTGKQLTVFAPRHNLLDDEYVPWCDDRDLTVKKIPSFYRDCASFEKDDNGEYVPIDDRAKELDDKYLQGLSGAQLHEEYNDLLCQGDGECPFMEARSFDPDNYDVLLGTYRHAYNGEWIEDRHVAFDEFPGDDYLKTFENGIAPVVSAYLEDEDALPFRNYFDLISGKRTQSTENDIEAWKVGTDISLHDRAHVQRASNPSAHTHGGMATLALLEMEELANGWQYSDLGQGRVAVRNPKENEWTFLLPPDLDSAKGVIALDGTPNTSLWELTLNECIRSLPLLNTSEKRAYLEDVLGLRLIQTTDRWKAINSGDGAAPSRDLALIEGVALKEERTPALISSKKGIRKYQQNGLDEITQKTEYYNNLKGMNDFAKERLGIILGCPHPGDDVIEKWSALTGESAERRTKNGERTSGNNVDYGPFGNEVLKTFVYDEVLQAAMRFGREEINGVRGATVYVHTSAIPEEDWIPVETQIAKIQRWQTEKEGVRDVINAIQSLEDWRHRVWESTELYEDISVTNHYVRDCLKSLAAQGYLKFCGKEGQTTPLRFEDRHLDDAGSFGHVEFPE